MLIWMDERELHLKNVVCWVLPSCTLIEKRGQGTEFKKKKEEKINNIGRQRKGKIKKEEGRFWKSNVVFGSYVEWESSYACDDFSF